MFHSGAYHVDLASNFALFVGKIITPDNTFLLICEPGKEQEAVIRLARIGYDKITGIL